MSPQATVRIHDDAPAPSYQIHATHGFSARFVHDENRWKWQLTAPVWKPNTPLAVRGGEPNTLLIADGESFAPWLAEFCADVALRAFTDGDIRLPFNDHAVVI